MPTYRNPGVYIGEISVFPPLVVEIETSLPAFIGYTSKATKNKPDDLILVPIKISSMKEYEQYFGLPFETQLNLAVETDGSGKFILTDFKETELQYNLYYSVRIYFDNGGTPCYLISVGTYQNPQQIVLHKNDNSPHYGLLDGLTRLAKIAEPSLVVIPEAVRLPANDYAALVQATLLQCSNLGDRFAIFDLYQGDRSDPDLSFNRDLFGSRELNCGSVYYPFVQTTMSCYINTAESNVKVDFQGKGFCLRYLRETNKPLYKFSREVLKNRFIILPPCGVVAGAYVSTDITRGVWKSPSNLNLAGVSEPVVNIDNRHQEILNVDPVSGKSINSIRVFAGKGIVLSGARTLDGNDNEWRYVPVRRFFIMVKESLQRSTRWVVYEPNDANTWLKVYGMIENYLTLKWQEGALAGVSPHQAFYVKCGLGSTMTDQDIREGRVVVEVGLAMLRPAEFISFKFAHQRKIH